VGTLLDTTVFIELERSLAGLPPDRAMSTVGARLVRILGDREAVGMAAITASELLHGVHRATPEHRVRRGAFVEALLVAFPPLSFDLLCARTHARIWADLAASGSDIGPHDRLVAATAIAKGWRVATANLRHFARVPGLATIGLDLDRD
jgi:tRNA(fMet)-specific endonuclease VapC